jgi:hypothetical protein
MFTDHGGPKPETCRHARGVCSVAGEENGGAGLLRFPNFSPDRTLFLRANFALSRTSKNATTPE